MKDQYPFTITHPEEITPIPSGEASKTLKGASFDASDPQQVLSDLKKLQDHSKYDKARFSFRLYKR